MHAVLLERYGEPSELSTKEVTRPRPDSGEVLVEVRAAAVNHSDLKNAQGGMAGITTLPRILGRDFAGVVVDGPREFVGTEVWGTGGDLGFTRDGTHAPYLAVSRGAVCPKPGSLSMEEAAAVGVPCITAWSALIELGGLAAGETVMVLGAAGAVGSTAVEIARWKGARVIGGVRDESEYEAAKRAGVDVIVDTSRSELPDSVMEETSGRGADLALDTVGGPMLEPSLRTLAPGGRMVSITTSAPRVSFDLLDFFRRELRLFGLNTLMLDAERCSRILDDLSPGFESGDLLAPIISESYPLEEAGTAYSRLASGEVLGRILLVPGRA